MQLAHLASGETWGLGDANILLARINRMVCIPTLSLKQLAILRLAKKYPGKTIKLYCEMPIINHGVLPTGYTAAIQRLIDLDLIAYGSPIFRSGRQIGLESGNDQISSLNNRTS